MVINPELKIPSYYAFRYKFLPNILKSLQKEIEKRLNDSIYISIIPDNWEYNLQHYIGLAAKLTYKNYAHDVVVLGICPIEGSTAELLQRSIEKIIGRYQFDYKKIKGNPLNSYSYF